MADDVYMAEDGLLHCKRCKGARQMILPATGQKVTVMCDCQAEASRREKEEKEEKEKYDSAMKSRLEGLRDTAYDRFSFNRDDGRNESIMTFAHTYINSFEKMKVEGSGLLLFGGTGTGKTFISGCIANELKGRKIPVIMMSVPDVITTIFPGRKFTIKEFLVELQKYELVILDDMGAEQNTDYNNAVLFQIIDQIYRAQIPFIVSTNFDLDYISNPGDEHRRIWSRILEKCIVLKVDGEDHRPIIGSEKAERFRELIDDYSKEKKEDEDYGDRGRSPSCFINIECAAAC